MGVPISIFLIFTTMFCFSIPYAASNSTYGNFLQCFYSQTRLSKSNSTLIFTKMSPLYTSVLQFSAQNLIFVGNSMLKPEVVVMPSHKSHIQASIIRARKTQMMVRVRSGGHDYEGLSYVSHQLPFVIIDIANLWSIKIDLKSETAWVESGATLGQLYYKIAEESRVHGFSQTKNNSIQMNIVLGWW
ncbi:Tetrahydrocannabinolic acid synthase [Bertholletia excelsa]